MAGYGPGCHPQNIILNKTNFKVLCTFTQGRISYVLDLPQIYAPFQKTYNC